MGIELTGQVGLSNGQPRLRTAQREVTECDFGGDRYLDIARLAALARNVASLASSALCLPPKMSGSQPASSPALNRLPVLVAARNVPCEADGGTAQGRSQSGGGDIAQRARA